MSTALDGYPALRAGLDAVGKPLVVLPQLQEVNALPCDTGSVRPCLNPPIPPLTYTYHHIASSPAI